jgi:hypothetical protein
MFRQTTHERFLSVLRGAFFACSHRSGCRPKKRYTFASESAIERLEDRNMMATDVFQLSATWADSAGSTDFVQSAPLHSSPAQCALPLVESDHFHDDSIERDTIPPVDLERMPQSSKVSDLAAFPLGDTFRLHTNPSASKVIYLDFDSHTTIGTFWNTSFNGGNPINTPAFSFEGDSSFSNSELERIQNIWERVAEDFSPFDVDVTTEDPGVEALRNTGGGDTKWGIRVAIGGSYNDWFLSPAGGVAYVDSFTWNSDTPCFVFSNNLGTGDEKYVAEAISHEVGHTLGLNHDGATGTEYYSGHGSGPTGWAPILGVGYYVNLVQWSRGEYPNATRTEDDLSIITTRNGFGYRADDHAGNSGAATPLTVLGTGVTSSSGVIERNTDVDFFSFAIGGGTLNLNISPFHRSPNLDILATLYNAAGTVIATSNPLNALDAAFSLSLLAGTYYLSIDGTGKPAGTDPGYSDYGSLGRYSLTASLTNPSNSEIDVRGNGVSISDGDTSPSAADGSDFGNQGVASGSVTRTFTISNSGSGVLNLTGSPRVQITGANASDFNVSVQPASSVAAGGSTTFQVVFDPSAAGLRTALVSIVNNDSNESLYDFAIQGTGTNVVSEAGDTLATALSTGLGAGGGTATHTGYAGNGAFGNKDVDMYSFQAAAGSRITIQTTQPSGSPALDTYLRLFNAAGTQLASDDDSGPSEYSLISNFTLTSAGTYYVGVSGYPNTGYNPNVAGSGAVGEAGNYQLALTLDTSTTIDDGSSGFSTSGNWTNNSSSSGYQGDHRISRSSSSQDTATWTFNAQSPGQYQVLARWVPSSSRLTNAPYRIYDNTTLLSTVNINQRNAPSGVVASGFTWQNLGTVSITSGTLKLALTDNASGTVSADAVRIVRVGSASPTPPQHGRDNSAQLASLTAIGPSSFSVKERGNVTSGPRNRASAETTGMAGALTSRAASTYSSANGTPIKQHDEVENRMSRHSRDALTLNTVDSVFASIGADDHMTSLRLSVL